MKLPWMASGIAGAAVMAKSFVRLGRFMNLTSHRAWRKLLTSTGFRN
jgi:hypothetical protein